MHCYYYAVFGFELPTTRHRMYVDPTTYAHVDEAVEEFAAEIPLKSIRLTEEIGNGEFGNVYCGIWKTVTKEQLKIAVKTLKVGRVKHHLSLSSQHYSNAAACA